MEVFPSTVVAALGIVGVIFIMFMVFASRYVKIGPNQVMIVSGRKRRMKEPDGTVKVVGYRIVKGGGTFVMPVIEQTQYLSLEVMTLDVNTPEIYTSTGVPILVDAIAQIKVGGDDVSISTAAEQFLSKRREEIMQVAMQTVEGYLRAIIGTLTVEEAYFNRETFAQKVQEVAAADLANMGLQIVSLTVRDIKDNRGYLEALGKPRIAQVKRDATIAEAQASRDSEIAKAEAARDAAQRSSIARQEAETTKLSQETKIADADREYQTKVAEYAMTVNQRKAEADMAYELQKNKTSQLVKREEIQVEVIAKEKQIEVQEKEIARKQKELDANIVKPADAERYKIQTLAEAEKFRVQTTADGQAQATKSLGFADADAQKAKGLAQADIVQAQGTSEANIIKAKGESEAEAMMKKAGAWQNYNQAALAQMIVERMPEIARAVADPLSKTEKIVIINMGDANSPLGASKVTRDVTEVIAQIPPVIEALTGVSFKDIVENIPALKNQEREKKAADNKKQ